MNQGQSFLFVRINEMKILVTFTVAVIMLLLFDFLSFSQVMEISPVKDNTIYSEADSSNGSGDFLFTGRNNKLAERRALIKFDLPDRAEVDSVVTVSLKMYLSKTTSNVQKINIFRLTSDWGEGESDAIFEEGGGAAPSTGDATWNFNFYDTESWLQAGGDYISTPSAAVTADTTGQYEWNDEGLLEDVDFWIDNPESNFGWIINTESSDVSSKRFNSRENDLNPPVLKLTTQSGNLSVTPDFQRNITVFPNPSDGDFTIRFHHTVNVRDVRIYDLSGREISVNDISKTQISPDEFHIHLTGKGVFIVVVDPAIHRKIIVR